ncbi:type II 3-dehydroquinate dehydratase [Granulicatella seriolae]|uniref:3-dehydroquinate dehydratase n=1 Tax=Granulicatella seriolae TaxID=2967226 RepID=A0ABT1WSW9_9LACT|nr:type II 3-dehydroquinate dehydratase [Granulicatella seriolae]
MTKILVINGPNINLLGEREPEIYGGITYDTLCQNLVQQGLEEGFDVECFQSNHEGDLIDKIQAERHNAHAFIINPGALTHYSYALYDCIRSVVPPFIEVHISNVHQREEFRHKSLIAPACQGSIVGLGVTGYHLALEYLMKSL